jgi:hypothetical protein
VPSRPRGRIGVVMSAAAESISGREPRGPCPPTEQSRCSYPRSQPKASSGTARKLLGSLWITGLVERRGPRRSRDRRSRQRRVGVLARCSWAGRQLHGRLLLGAGEASLLAIFDSRLRISGTDTELALGAHCRPDGCWCPVTQRRPSEVPRPELAGRTRRRAHGESSPLMRGGGRPAGPLAGSPGSIWPLPSSRWTGAPRDPEGWKTPGVSCLAAPHVRSLQSPSRAPGTRPATAPRGVRSPEHLLRRSADEPA